MNNYPFEFAKAKMNELKLPDFTINPVLITIPDGSTVIENETNDYSVLVNFFATSGIVNGNIEADNQAFDLSPALANSNFAKIKFLHGQLHISNNAEFPLFVEILRITPVSKSESK